MDHPHWYQRALDVPSTSGTVAVVGADIRYRVWGEQGRPGLVLIHGSNAHHEWWRFVAPLLADQFRVAALDLSGNGDSDWRERYTGELFAREVWGVCEAAELGDRPTVVGHSFGGFVALETAHRYGANLRGVILMDFTVAPPEQYLEWGRRAERENARPGRTLRVYEDEATILGRFRLLPEQPGVYPPVLEHMARAGIKRVEGGWTWKFDPTLFDYLEMGVDQRDKFATLACRSAVVLAEQSDDEGALFSDHMLAITGGHLPVFRIPGTHHHLMFDEPVASAMATKAIVLEWLREDHADVMRATLARAVPPAP
jgi:pimeloyl-ACP methyl ester carboxylesterase